MTRTPLQPQHVDAWQRRLERWARRELVRRHSRPRRPVSKRNAPALTLEAGTDGWWVYTSEPPELPTTKLARGVEIGRRVALDCEE